MNGIDTRDLGSGSDGDRVEVTGAPELASPLGLTIEPAQVAVLRDDNGHPETITVLGMTTNDWKTLRYRRDGQWPERFADAPGWLLELAGVTDAEPAGAGLTAPGPISVAKEKRRHFEGFETRIEVSGAPTLHDLLPPYREFNPEAVLVLHYRRGHWQDQDPYTHVTVVGGCIDDSRTPGRIEWDTNQPFLPDYLGTMPEWLRAFVQVHTGVDLSGWNPPVVKMGVRR